MVEQKNDATLTERLDKLQYKRGFADAVAGYRPAVFDGAYMVGYKIGLGEREIEDPNFEINSVRFDYDLPTID